MPDQNARAVVGSSFSIARADSSSTLFRLTDYADHRSLQE
jgi:hypothetical protein